MLVFPNCKINLGLHVTSRRADGFHNIETIFYPVDWCDALEVIETGGGKAFQLSQSGLPVSASLEENLVYKAWKILSSQKKLPPLTIHLHKNIPMGAGLGGGSADAAFFINLLDKMFGLGYTPDERRNIASQLGSDCAFFIGNHPVFARGRGNEFSEIAVDLSAYYILLVYPNIHSNTKEAYSGLTPKAPANNLQSVGAQPATAWKDLLVNDFELSVFKKHPQIAALKSDLYNSGAVYAGMSGSGSAVFGIFRHEPVITFNHDYSFFLKRPAPRIL